jgi:hypothetical protein
MESVDKGVPGQTAKGFIAGEENSMMAKEGSFEGPGFGSKQPDLNSDGKKGMEHRNASSSATESPAELGGVLLSDAEVYYESLLGQLDFSKNRQNHAFTRTSAGVILTSFDKSSKSHLPSCE